MKIETAAIWTKGFCFMVLGATIPAGTGLAQWLNSGTWPPAINWVGICIGAAGGAATQLLSFLSQSFGDYKAQVRADAGQPPTPLMVGNTPIADAPKEGKVQP